MKPVSLLFIMGLTALLLVAGCESQAPTGVAEKGMKTTEAGEEKAAKEEKASGAETAVMAPSGSPGRMENDEGVSHYNQGHWDVAEVHFRKATNADPALAVAHFNLALALDKLNKHGDATQHFKKALELAPNDPQIAQSQILKAHVGM